MIALRLIALAVGLAALHLTYLYYRRSHFSKQELLFWAGLWGVFISTAFFPSALLPISSFFGLARPMDLIMIGAFVLLFVLVFHNYIMARSHERMIERIVRAEALKGLKKE